jgi:hypothetical protein
MEFNAIGRARYHLRLATISPEVLLHQTEADLDVITCTTYETGGL